METEQNNKNKQIIDKIKKGLSVVEEFVNRAIYTDWFLIGTLVICFITWATKCAPFGIIAMGILLSFVMIFSRDILVIFSGALSSSLMLYTQNTVEFLYLWPMLIPLGLSFVFFIVRNSFLKRKAGDKFQLGKLFFPQLAVSVALLLGGVGVVSGQVYLGSLTNILLLGVAGLVIYVLARNFTNADKSVDRPTYFAKVLAYIGVIVALQLFVVVAESGKAPETWATAYWHVGWGNRNNISTYLLFTAPMCFYLATKYRYGIIYMFLGAIQYTALIVTFSRGGILFGFIALVFGIVFLLIKSKNRKHQIVNLAIVAGVLLLLYLCFMDFVNAVFTSLLSRGTGVSGRDSLYSEAWELFKQNPVQGNGLGFVGSYGIFGNMVQMYWFHSTLFQVLACMGIIGILAYGYSYVMKGIILGKNIRNGFNLFVVVVFIGFEGYSMMDTGTFIPGGYPLIVLILMSIVEIFTSTPEAVAFDKLEMQVEKEKATAQKRADKISPKLEKLRASCN